MVKMNLKKAIIIVVAVLLYGAFVYYRFHYYDFTPISGIIAGGILFFIGLYAVFIEKSVSFRSIKTVCIIFLVFYIVSHILVIIGMQKHGLIKGVDITLTWVKNNLDFLNAGNLIVYTAIFLIYFIFPFIVAGTYRLLGKEHVFLWMMIFSAWIASNIKLFVNYVLQ